MPPDKSAKQGPEFPSDALNQINEMLERWKDRPDVSNLRFVERYIKLECQILLHFTFGRSDVEYIAFLHRDFPQLWPDRNGGNEINSVITGKLTGKFLNDSWRNAMKLILRADRNQQTVLAEVVKAVQTPERPISGEKLIPTFVWFDRADKVNRILPKALYISAHSGFVLFGGLTDREAESLPWRINTRMADSKQLVDKVIQRTPEIAEDISNDNGDFKRDSLEAVNVINQLSCLRIALGTDYIGIGAAKSEPLNFRLQIREMLFGPINFY